MMIKIVFNNMKKPVSSSLCTGKARQPISLHDLLDIAQTVSATSTFANDHAGICPVGFETACLPTWILPKALAVRILP